MRNYGICFSNELQKSAGILVPAIMGVGGALGGAASGGIIGSALGALFSDDWRKWGKRGLGIGAGLGLVGGVGTGIAGQRMAETQLQNLVEMQRLQGLV